MVAGDDAAREGRITFARIAELKLNPVLGTFDVAHLREVHRRIFQDLPHHGPGAFRPDAPGHMKDRALEATRFRYAVPYALRAEVDQRLDAVLAEVRGGAALQGLPPANLASRMATLYGDLDHLHPFREGNSRALRSFTEQLACRSGYALDWGTTNANAVTRDNLYMARDFAVIQRAYPGIAGKDPADIGSRDEYAAYLALGELQKADRLSEIVRQSVDRGVLRSGETRRIPLADLRAELDQLLLVARHQAQWDEERARITAARKPDLAAVHEEALRRQQWIAGIDSAGRMIARVAAAGVTGVDIAAVPGERAVERVIGFGKAIAAAERQHHRDIPGPASPGTKTPPRERER